MTKDEQGRTLPVRRARANVEIRDDTLAAIREHSYLGALPEAKAIRFLLEAWVAGEIPDIDVKPRPKRQERKLLISQETLKALREEAAARDVSLVVLVQAILDKGAAAKIEVSSTPERD